MAQRREIKCTDINEPKIRHGQRIQKCRKIEVGGPRRRILFGCRVSVIIFVITLVLVEVGIEGCDANSTEGDICVLRPQAQNSARCP